MSIRISKQSTSSRKYLYNRVPPPDQVPNFQFEEIPTAAESDEEEMQGHFTESSWPSLKSTSKDFSEADWIDWVNHAQYYPTYVVSDDYEAFELFPEPSSQLKPGVSFSLYNVACARKLLFAFSHLSFIILQDLTLFKNFYWSCEVLLLDARINARIRKYILQALIRIPHLLDLHEKIHPILQTANNLLEAYEASKRLGFEIVDSFDQFMSNDYATVTADGASKEKIAICLEGFQLLAKHQVQSLNAQEHLLSEIQAAKKTLEEELAHCNLYWKDFHSNVTFSILK